MGKHTAELSPHQSVTTLLVSVEDLINMAMGPDHKNVVNYKLIQTVLHILARQMRLLEQKVEIRVTEYITHREKAQQEEKERERPSHERSSREPSRSKERSKSSERLKAETAEAKEKEKQLRTAEKERRNIERVLQKEKERAERAKEKEGRAADRTTSKERDKGEKAAAKDREREERATSKERKKADKAAAKEREREERGASKERDKADKAATKEREKDERGASKERDKADKAAAKEREREDRGVSKERDKADKAAAKEREREERGALKEREKADKAAAKERDREERGASREREKADKAAAKEREREERGASKEREKADKAAAKEWEREERGASKEREKADKAAAKEREREERGASKDRERAEKSAAKDREREEKAAAKADRDASKDRERDERGSSKERERAEKAAAKDKEREEKAAAKADRDASKDRERDEKGASKERERAEKAAAKEREREEKYSSKADREASREREREEKASAKADKAAAKEREKEDRAATKDERASAKERETEDRAQSKEREKAEKAAAKEGRATEKEREKELKEAAKAEKYEMKDKARAEKEPEKGSAKAEKEMTKAEKAAAKEREREQEKAERGQEKAERGQEKAEREREKAEREKDAMAGAIGKKGKRADAGIAVKEEARDKEKVLVVEKGPTTRSGGATRSNIEVVTRSQFDLLKDIVNDLAEKAGPLPMPSMPQNKELLQRLSKGTASLTDMMDAMQVSARVVAAEQAIGRMGGILTQLATAGALPEDIAGQVGEVTTELEAELQEANERAQEAAEAHGGDQLSLGATGAAGRPSKPRVSISRKSIIAQKSRASTLGGPSLSGRPSLVGRASTAASVASGTSEKGVPKVTHPELDSAIRQLIEDLKKNMGNITAKSTASVENSMAMVKSMSDKLETALKVNSRITSLYAMVTDYAEQLSGFDAGVTTQMQSFSEQIAQMRGDLGSGLKLLESVNNNAETAAVMELTERYEGLVSELDNTLLAHTGLDLTQVQLAEDLSSLLAAVEMLREQKADRDEVLDGLRDKADTSRLAGLLTEVEFYASRRELERRLAVCHEKFGKQEQVWMKAIQDLKDIIEVKADLVHLLGTREEVQRSLEILHEMCRNLALVLGEPKAAILTRKLTRGALCGACMVPALMSPADARAGGPPRLPGARPRPAGAPAEVCDQELKLPPPPDTREHMCNRWVGGSHTLISDAVSRLQAEPMTFPVVPTNRYMGQGNDGRLYQMEEELQPCVECNKLSDQAEGAPAEGGNPNVVNVTAP